MRERRSGDGTVELEIFLENDYGGGSVGERVKRVLAEIDRCFVSAARDEVFTKLVIKCPEGICDEVKEVIDDTLRDARLPGSICGVVVGEVFSRGDGEKTVFRPGPSRGDGGGFDSGDGGGAAYQC